MKRGFSLIELLIVVAILATLSGGAILSYGDTFRVAVENTQRNNQRVIRKAIDEHHADYGHYPATLDRLVETGYLREVPLEPSTQSKATWICIASGPEASDVYDVMAPQRREAQR